LQQPKSNGQKIERQQKMRRNDVRMLWARMENWAIISESQVSQFEQHDIAKYS